MLRSSTIVLLQVSIIYEDIPSGMDLIVAYAVR
jgi:hypothetical protein